MKLVDKPLKIEEEEGGRNRFLEREGEKGVIKSCFKIKKVFLTEMEYL